MECAVCSERKLGNQLFPELHVNFDFIEESRESDPLLSGPARRQPRFLLYTKLSLDLPIFY
jgi:hypothetical protein